MPDSKDKKSRFGLFGHKDRPTPTTDSTYGSENSSDAHNSYQSAPSMTGSDNTGTTINDQGQTVTTTTTTTTTTTSGGGGASTTSGPHTSNLANRLDPRVNSSSDQTEVSETVQRREIDRPNIPPKSMRRDPSPNPPSQQRSGGGGGLSSILSGGRHHEQRQPEHHGNQNQPQQQPSGGGGLSSTLSGRRSHDQRQPDNYGSSNAPPQQQSSGAGGLSSILTGGRNHDQGQADNYGSPSSPQGRHNFSYPSRTPPNERAPMQAQGQEQVPVPQQHPSTLQNLKTAAVGIHGVGETLRGTLNSSVDRRFHASPEQQAHNERVLNAGRQEIESGHLSEHSKQQGGPGTKGILRKGGAQGQLRVVNE